MKNNPKRKMRKRSIIVLITLLLSLSGIQASHAPLQNGSDEWVAPPSSKDVKNPLTADETTIAAGKKIYTKDCYTCHGSKGKGDGPNAVAQSKAPKDLLLPKTQSQTDGELFWKISEGKKPMPTNKKTLTEEQRWQVLIYVRELAKQAKKK